MGFGRLRNVLIRDADGNSATVESDGSINVNDGALSSSGAQANPTLTSGAEATVLIPAGTKKMSIRLRDKTVSWKYAWVALGTATLFTTVEAGGEWYEGALSIPTGGLNFYALQASGGPLVLECDYMV